MVQRKVSNNKLGSQANNTLKTEKKPGSTKLTLQNHDGKTKVGDLKAIRMKKTRSIKWSDIDISICSAPRSHEPPQQPGKPPPLVTPSPKKPSPSKSPYASPNYMKSTSSSEARKEKTTKVSSISSTSKLHRVVPKTLSKTSSLKKVRTLTKAPSFKHTRLGANKKVVLCERNLDVQKNTCSSTLKDSKFPPYLTLNPGATEAEGTSVMKVCPYNYCSLNGHHHNPSPPLRCFLSSRRRLLKTQKVVEPEVPSPSKAKPSGMSAMPEKCESEDFFVEIYVPGRESLSDGPCSEDMNLSLGDEDNSLTPVQDQTSSECSNYVSDQEVDSSPSVSSDEFFGEALNLEWEEGQISTTHNKCEISVESDYSCDQDEPGFKSDNGGGYLEEFKVDKFPPYFHDEIMEFICFSDAESFTDSESTHTGNQLMEEPVTVKENDSVNSGPENEVVEGDSTLGDDSTIYNTKLEDDSIDERSSIFSDLIDEITAARKEGPDEPNEDNYRDGESGEENNTGIFMEENLHLNESIVEVKAPEKEDIKPQEANIVSHGGTDSTKELLERSNKLKRSVRCKRADEDDEEEREFNPRGPKFLPVEPDPETEKVDLRHQEIDERRNAEEWMLDYALQKTVNQLAPARKRKVALLVEAFEAVMPIRTYEPHMRGNSSGFAHARPIQACS